MTTPARPRDPERHCASIHGGPFSYTDEGQGPAIVAIHGLPGSVRDFRWLGAALPDSVRFLRIDLPGFGGTPLATAHGPGIDERGAFIAKALAALDVSRCVLVGHSMGGAAALSAAVQAPARVAALALLASIGLRPHRLLRRFVAKHWFARAVDRPLLRGPVRGVLRAAFRSAGFPAQTTTDEVAQTVRCIAAVNFEAQARNTAKLAIPTLCAWADDDDFIEGPVFEEHTAALPPGPRLRWTTGGHNIQKSHAVELAEALVVMTQS